MNSGELREEVTVLRPVDGRDSFGAVTTTYEEQQTLRMKVVVCQSGTCTGRTRQPGQCFY